MGIFNAISDAFNEIKDEAVSAYDENTQFLNEYEEKKKAYLNTKRKILKKLTLNQLKKVCDTYDLEHPILYEEDIFTGKRYKVGNERSIYQNYLWEDVYLDELIDFCKKRKIDIKNALKDKENYDKKINSKNNNNKSVNANNKKPISSSKNNSSSSEKLLDFILKKINQKFNGKVIRDERELEGKIEVFLELQFEKSDIKTQFKTPNGLIDIAVDEKYGIEIKIAENNKIIENLEAQVRKYIRYFGKNNVAVIIVKTPKTNEKKLEEYIEYYKNDGAKVLVLDNIEIKRRKNNTKVYLKDK